MVGIPTPRGKWEVIGPSETTPEDKRETAANERGCYCGIWDTDPTFYPKQGVPPGYCGICLRCGEPGHTRHFPGPVPFTGEWCDRCYAVLKWTWPFRSVMGWLYVLAVIAIASVLARPFIDAMIRTFL